MSTNKNHKAPERSEDEIKAWMEEHPQEYGEFAADMSEADLLAVFLLGQSAFSASPEFRKRLEDMIDLDNLDLEELLKILRESGYTRIVLDGNSEDSEWEKHRMPFAAWLKYGRSSEMLIENIEDASQLIDNRQYQWQLSKFLKAFMTREIENNHRTRKELKEFLDFRKSVDNGDLADWVLDGIEKLPPTAKISEDKEFVHDLTSLLSSHDSETVRRIGKWTQTHISGVDIAHLYIALVESGELDARRPVKQFAEILAATFPESKIVGERQVQKSVNALQSLSPNRKQYVKDEPEHRFAIDKIKTGILLINPDNVG